MDSPLTELSVYVKGNAAHLVRHFQDSDEIYIFCNRFMGKAGGVLYSVEEFDALKYNATPICARCQAAVETAIERFGVLQGFRPTQLKEAAAKLLVE
jgi:hypothetical protein